MWAFLNWMTLYGIGLILGGALLLRRTLADARRRRGRHRRHLRRPAAASASDLAFALGRAASAPDPAAPPAPDETSGAVSGAPSDVDAPARAVSGADGNSEVLAPRRATETIELPVSDVR